MAAAHKIAPLRSRPPLVAKLLDLFPIEGRASGIFLRQLSRSVAHSFECSPRTILIDSSHVGNKPCYRLAMPRNHDLFTTLHAVKQSQEIPYSKLVSDMVEWVVMETRKITVEIPQALLEKAQQASGAGITETVRTGLQLLAASQAYDNLRQLRGKVRFSRTWEELKEDRE
jgi:hypothetical protein